MKVITEAELEHMEYVDLNSEEFKSVVAQKLQIQVIVGLFIVMIVLMLLSLVSWFNYRSLLSKYYDSKQKNLKKPSSQLINPQFTPITKDLDMKIRRH
ncbi:hypothetical protein RB653_005737 [Dictyostelium firmibasis]|uniref:Uncharacterized protein n=1 Tax=Dictyostelium firmibasis TaxID=79012 RepID=A0AAN7UD69_9MYCE